MKQEFRKQGVKMKRLHSKAVDQNNVSLLIRRQRLERDPAENQRKSNQYSEDTSPEEQLVHPPAQCRTASNEGLGRKLCCREAHKPRRSAKDTRLAEKLPASFPIHSRGGLIEPHAIVVDDAPSRKDRRERVDDQGWIKVLKVTRPHHDGGYQQASEDCGRDARSNAVRRPGERCRQGQLGGLLPGQKNRSIGAP